MEKFRVGVDVPRNLVSLVYMQLIVMLIVACVVKPVFGYPALGTLIYVAIVSAPFAVGGYLLLSLFGWVATRFNARKS